MFDLEVTQRIYRDTVGAWTYRFQESWEDGGTVTVTRISSQPGSVQITQIFDPASLTFHDLSVATARQLPIANMDIATQMVWDLVKEAA